MGMATGQPGGEGESVFSKILPGGAAEQAGKLTEGEGCSRDGDRAVVLFCTEMESGTSGMIGCSQWDAVLPQFGAQGSGGPGSLHHTDTCPGFPAAVSAFGKKFTSFW